MISLNQKVRVMDSFILKLKKLPTKLLKKLMVNFSKKRKFSLVDSSREMSESENMVIVPNSLQMFS